MCDHQSINQHINPTGKMANYSKSNCSDPKLIQGKNETNDSVKEECKREVNNSIAHVKQPDTRTLEFTPEMIRDQELLVTSMSQMGLAEPLIRRQFDRLLDEQTKQLQYMRGPLPTINKQTDNNVQNVCCAIPKETVNYQNCNQPTTRQVRDQMCCSSCDTQINNFNFVSSDCQLNNNVNVNSNNAANEDNNNNDNANANKNSEYAFARKIEPSSLIKIRMEKEAYNKHEKNNGLQEAAVAFEIMKKYKHYPRNRVNKHKDECEPSREEPPRLEDIDVRLNGAQDTSAMQNYYQHLANFERGKFEAKGPSANGLENSRHQCLVNATGPAMNAHDSCTPTNVGFQSQCQNSTPSTQLEHPRSQSRMPAVDNCCAGRYFQPEQQSSDPSNLIYWPDYHEPKVIGGITYLARKPLVMPTNQVSYPSQ